MRRAQVDKNSQPVRNQATNPSFEATGTSQTVRTNLCTHPGGELASSTAPVRTNYITNPNFEVNATGWLGQVATITRVTTEFYSGTASLSVTTDGTLGSGAYFSPATITGSGWNTNEPCVASVWVKGPAGKQMTASLITVGAATNSPQVFFTATGAWQEVTMLVGTIGAAATTVPYIYIRQAIAEAAYTFYIDQAIIEKSRLIGPYFDGSTSASGEFTYAWSGTAHASTSTQRATGLAGWMGSSLGAPYQTALQSHSGTKCVAVATKGTSGDGVYHTDVVVVPGVSYTFSAWIKVTEAQSMYANMRWKEYPSNVTISDLTAQVSSSLVVGQWTRVSYTTVCPPGATRLQCMWRIFATHTPTTFFVDSVLIEDRPVLMDYFDGTTPAVGDFTYAWTGTANASSSQQRGTGYAGTGITNGGVASVASTEWAASGTKSIRLIPTATTNDSWVAVGGDTGAMRLGLEAGKTYTILATSRLTAPQTGTLHTASRRVRLFQRIGAGSYTAVDSIQAPNAAGVTSHRITHTLPAGVTEAFIRLQNGTTAGNGEIWWDDLMVVEGNYTGGYLDGTKPFSKWDGTAHASTSVGYPPSA